MIRKTILPLAFPDVTTAGDLLARFQKTGRTVGGKARGAGSQTMGDGPGLLGK